MRVPAFTLSSVLPAFDNIRTRFAFTPGADSAGRYRVADWTSFFFFFFCGNRSRKYDKTRRENVYVQFVDDSACTLSRTSHRVLTV